MGFRGFSGSRWRGTFSTIGRGSSGGFEVHPGTPIPPAPPSAYHKINLSITAIYQLVFKPSKNFRYAFHIFNRDRSLPPIIPNLSSSPGMNCCTGCFSKVREAASIFSSVPRSSERFRYIDFNGKMVWAMAAQVRGIVWKTSRSQRATTLV